MSFKAEPLASMCEAIVDCPHSTPVWTNSGFVVLRNQNIKGGRLDLSAPSYTDEEHFKQRVRRMSPRAGDIVITREAPMGDVCKIPEGLICCLGQRQVLLRPKAGVNPDYLLYALQSPSVQDQIRWNEGTGSTVSNIRIPVLEKIEIPRLGQAEEPVAAALKSVDDKIDVNRRINQTLEAMAQAIFKSWFVDFEPVKAKIAAKAALTPALSQREREERVLRAAMSAISGKTDAELDALKNQQNVGWVSPERSGGRNPTNGIEVSSASESLGYGYRSSASLRTGLTQPTQEAPSAYDQLAATAALFPDEMEESELGEIPRGWAITPIRDVAKVVKGKSYSSKDLVDNDQVALVTLKSFERGGGFRMDGFKPYVGPYKSEQVVLPGDLIVAYTDVTQAAELIGKPAVVVGVDHFKTLVASLDVGIVRPVSERVSRQFLNGLFMTDAFQSHTFAHTSGTTVLHLAKDGVPSYIFACPDERLVGYFSEVAETMAMEKQKLLDQNRSLATLRDTLLPKLLSGELSVENIAPASEATP